MYEEWGESSTANSNPGKEIVISRKTLAIWVEYWGEATHFFVRNGTNPRWLPRKAWT